MELHIVLVITPELVQGGNMLSQLQQNKPALDGLAVASGFAVWSQYVPTWVGIITILYLGTQIIINLPKVWSVMKDLYNKLRGK